MPEEDQQAGAGEQVPGDHAVGPVEAVQPEHVGLEPGRQRHRHHAGQRLHRERGALLPRRDHEGREVDQHEEPAEPDRRRVGEQQREAGGPAGDRTAGLDEVDAERDDEHAGEQAECVLLRRVRRRRTGAGGRAGLRREGHGGGDVGGWTSIQPRPGRRRKGPRPLPFSRYSRVGALWQGPRPGAQSPAETPLDRPGETLSLMATSPFDLPPRLTSKADPALIAGDERHFAAVADSPRAHDRRPARAASTRPARAPGGSGQQALERDQEVHRLTARLRDPAPLRPGPLPGAHGRAADGAEPVYVGRLGLTDADGRRLLVDWRSPAAEPFFARDPRQPDGPGQPSPLPMDPRPDHRLLGRGLHPGRTGGARRPRRPVGLHRQSRRDPLRRGCATCSAPSRPTRTRSSAPDSRGALVVDGGPGTGKTVVALHRTAYLLYSDPRLGHDRGGVLFVGPHRPYLAYVSDVLPSLGEEGVQTCTLRDLVPEGADAAAEPDPEVAGSRRPRTWCAAIEDGCAVLRGAARPRA